MTRDAIARAAGALHAPLIVVLVAMRPLVWDGAWGDLAALAWQALVLVGCAAAAIEIRLGATTPRLGAVGVALVATLALLAPAALRSPLHADGLATWGMWAMHALFAWWLAHAARGRERLLAGALIAGLAGEAAVALGQRRWSLPALAQRIARGDAATVPGVGLDDLAERVARGGVFGTFTQGNALGAYLALTLPLAAAVAWRPGPRASRALCGAIAVAGAAAFATTDSKGAWAALAAAIALAATLRVRGAWRVAPAVALAALACVALAAPRARAALAASADVRVDYWRAAVALIAQRPLVGHGVRGFAAEYPRAMPLAAEPTRYAHCEPLEAAVAGGVPAGLALGALLVLVVAAAARVRVARDDSASAPAPTAIERWSPVALIIAPAYAHLFGAIDIGDWPGAGDAAGEMAWLAGLGALLAATCALARLAPPPPRCALLIALAAAALHACIDFDLHAGGVVGTLVAVACLAAPPRVAPRARGAGIAIATGVVVAAAIAAFGFRRSCAIGDAQDLVTSARAAFAPARTMEATGDDAPSRARRRLAAMLGLPAEQRLDELVERARTTALATCRAWPRAEPDIEFDVLSLWPPGADSLPLVEDACAADPHSARGRAMLASALGAVGRWDDAITAQRACVALSPAYVPAHMRLAALEREAAKRLPSRAAELSSDADAVAAQAERLQAVVHPRDRAR